MARVLSGGQIIHAQVREHVAQIEHALYLGGRRRRVVQRYLRARNASHVREIPRSQRHEERARARAMDDSLHRIRARVIADESDRGWKIVLRRLVERELAKR
jgi:hypothetical protein